MYYINKLISVSAVDFAAEELKKYLRMMMPEGGDVKIAYNPDAADGFRLGLMQDFGLDVSDAENTELDDILYMDCDEKGGIIAGSNPRSVLLAVYEYLRQLGCRWLFPGVDGEYIPMKDIAPVKLRHKPTMRYRGWCNEGAEYQQCMYDAIDFAPKVGLNIFMMEAHIPFGYYNNYYSHPNNSEYRAPEPVSKATIVQWKRACETEIAKRGLQFHDIGHGWTAYPFGVSFDADYTHGNEDSIYGDNLKYIAYADGKRGVYRGNFMNTNYCMSNREARDLVTASVVEHAKKHPNADYIHVWLSDGMNNHCECEECKKKTPSDWYMIQLNEIDEALTREKLDSKIVFIAYLDTVWAPLEEKIRNTDRFTMLVAPISRTYSESVKREGKKVGIEPYKRNQNKLPATLGQYFEYFDEWKKKFEGSKICYEYHFWRAQFYDIAGIELSKVINGDVKAYREVGISGIIEDGSQRCFFPTGLLFYTYARTLFDASLSADEIREDYFSHTLGEGKEEIEEYLTELSDAFDHFYLMKRKSKDETVSPYYNPDKMKDFARVPEIVTRAREVIKKYYNSDIRVQTASVRLLEVHLIFAEYYARALCYKCQGKDDEAFAKFQELRLELGKYEAEFEGRYDFNLSILSLKQIFDSKVFRLPTAEIQD